VYAPSLTIYFFLFSLTLFPTWMVFFLKRRSDCNALLTRSI